MSYHRKPLGDVAGALSAVATGAAVVKDPYFGEVVCRVGQLRAIENHETVPPCVTTQAGIAGGVGLRKAMPALRAYVWAERNRPMSYVAIVGAAVGVPMLLGYLLGKGR